MHQSNRSVTLILFTAVALTVFMGAAPRNKVKRPARNSKVTKQNQVNGKALTPAVHAAFKRIQGLFNSWDRNKDDSVTQDELDRFYRKLKAQSQKVQAKRGQVDDPMAPVRALQTKIDSDKDKTISRDEYDTWAADFAGYVTTFQELYVQLYDKTNELTAASVPAPKKRSMGFLADNLEAELNLRLKTGYQMDVDRLKSQLAELDPNGEHRPYSDFLFDTYFAKFFSD